MQHRSTILFGGTAMLLGLAVFLYAQSFPSLPEGYPGPSLFPQIVAIGLFLCGITLVIGSFQKKQETATPSSSRGDFRRLGFGIALAALYPLAYPFIAPLQYEWGLAFSPGLILLGIQVFAIAWLTEVPLRSAVIAGLLSPVIIYGVFTLLLGVSL